MSSSLKMRLISAVIAGPISLAIFFYGGLPFLILMSAAFCLATHEWLDLSRKTKRFWLYAIVGLIYFALCFLSFIAIRMDFTQGFFMVVSVAMVIWAGDVGAYFSGKAIGGPKMARAISPNKTWAGLIGGMVFSGLYMLALYYIGPQLKDLFNKPTYLPLPNAFYAFGIGASLTVVGQVGDLLISAAKRKAGIKDTGVLIPGHGGLLDRIDSMLLGSLFFFIVLLVLGV